MASVNGMKRKKRLLLGCTSKKTKEKAADIPIHSTIKPAINLTSADTGVKFPNALLLKNLGNASCSMALKQYSF